MNCVKPLEWDSKFFGYSVARVDLDKEGVDSLNTIFNQLKEKKIRLTYFFVPPQEEKMNKVISSKGAILADKKVIYTKVTKQYFEFQNEIVEMQSSILYKAIEYLALQSGKYSRYKIDTNFKNNEFEKLYIEWIKKSLNKTIAFTTIVSKAENNFTGLTTIGDKGHYADIGLVAVKEDFRGRGIGLDLVHTADTIAYSKGFNEIKVVTQLQNIGACKLYEKCQFRIENITNTYHYWQ